MAPDSKATPSQSLVSGTHLAKIACGQAVFRTIGQSEGKGSLMSESAPPILKSSATDVAVDQKLRINDGKQCHQMGLDSISSSSHYVGTASRDPTCPFCDLPRPLGAQSS